METESVTPMLREMLLCLSFDMLNRDGEHSLMQTGDTFIVEVLSIQHPDWRYLFDGDKEAGIATRLSFLKELADSGMMILAYHNDFPGLGRIYRQSTGYGLRSTRYQI